MRLKKREFIRDQKLEFLKWGEREEGEGGKVFEGKEEKRKMANNKRGKN